jgi:hypothetical protein
MVVAAARIESRSRKNELNPLKSPEDADLNTTPVWRIGSAIRIKAI